MEENLAILIPAHNEAESIGNLVREVKKIVPDVFVVDDGSTDDTGKIAEENGAIVIRHSVCLGKGAALKTGFAYLKKLSFNQFITMDGDGQHLPSDIHIFLKALRKNKRAGIIVGKRKIIGTNMPFLRRITNLSMSLLISLLACQWIPDSQNGFRAIRKEVVEKMKLITDHFETETEILLRASWKGVKIVSVPVTTVYNKKRSKIKPVQDTVNFFLMILKILTGYGKN